MAFFHILSGAVTRAALPPNRGKPNDISKSPGAYCITNVATGNVYIGSTGTLGCRVSGNESCLRRGVHRNPNLQKAYDESAEIEFLLLPTTTVEEARILEQQLVDEFKDSGHLCNIGITDVSRPAFRRIVSDQTKQLMSKNRYGIVPDDATKELMSATHKDYYNSERSQAHRKVLFEKISKKVTVNGVEYPSISEAARQLNTTNWKISHGTYVP